MRCGTRTSSFIVATVIQPYWRRSEPLHLSAQFAATTTKPVGRRPAGIRCRLSAATQYICSSQSRGTQGEVTISSSSTMTFLGSGS